MALPISPSIGGKGSNILKSDMTSTSKTPNKVGKKVGSMPKTMKGKSAGARKRA